MEDDPVPELYPKYIEGHADGKFFEAFKSVTGVGLKPFLCARSAMVSGLQSLGFSRTDEILVPPYLSHCVLSALGKICFPTMTPSSRTKAILAYHQYGFPQQVEEIEKEAGRRGWVILNDCATSLFTKVKGESIIRWGTFSVVSLAKFFHCGMGGGLWSKEEGFLGACSGKEKGDSDAANGLFEHYVYHFEVKDLFLAGIMIHAIYGCIPIIKSLPQRSLDALPSSQKEIVDEISRRERIYGEALSILDDRIPHCLEGVVPFAVPILGERHELERLSMEILSKFSLRAEVLHFDVAMNMLSPDYRDALVIGCHDQWKEEILVDIFQLVKRMGG